MQTSGNNGQDDPGEYAMQLVSASVLPVVLKAAIKLGVFDVIDKAGSGDQLYPSQIAAQIAPGNKPEAPLVLERILRLLANHSILTCSVSDDQIHRVVYGLAPVARYFVQNRQEGSGSVPLETPEVNPSMGLYTSAVNSMFVGQVPVVVPTVATKTPAINDSGHQLFHEKHA
ncbi:hypothetical protein Ddye_003011 [Dipteronia dyeriana]|uniref:O-methyltransferase dimerisation domain-containing protein n=1 Tax=Dipteronia dyeriana TaxID=168575 RepID=A0AAE0CUW9_9ROSI|nr:hypothetical protein Ddye_003011 [Dipteronia dyeriana]